MSALPSVLADLDALTFTADQVRRGIAADSIESLSALGLDRQTVLGLVGAPSTLRKRIANRANLSREESDRLARIARVTAEAIRVFGTPEKAVHWLQRPSRSRADGAKPVELLDTDPGAQWVEERLRQIEYGIYA